MMIYVVQETTWADNHFIIGVYSTLDKAKNMAESNFRLTTVRMHVSGFHVDGPANGEFWLYEQNVWERI